MDERFIRQSFLGVESVNIHRHAKIAIIGLGGGGSHIAQQLAHIGIGDFLLIDPDVAKKKNHNRLVGAHFIHVLLRKLKVKVAKKMIKAINPFAKVTIVYKDWVEVAELLADCDIIIGCVDTFIARRDIEATARRFMIPYIDIGMDVHEEGDWYRITGQVILSMPGCACMQCMGFISEHDLAEEAGRYGAAGNRPQVIWPNGVLASTAVGLLIQLLTPWHQGKHQSLYIEYDGNMNVLGPSNKMPYIEKMDCPHYSSATGLGDPFLHIIKKKRTEEVD